MSDAKKERTCRHPDGPRHDCRYVDAVAALVPEATRLAREEARARGLGDDAQELPPARLFHQHMDRLAHGKGLRRLTKPRMVELGLAGFGGAEA